MITVPLPGLTKDDVKVSLIDGCINISATRPKTENTEKKEGKDEMNCCGFTMPPFSVFWDRDINIDVPIPVDADKEKITSKMANGLLKIKVEKKPPKPIDIAD